MRHVLGLHRLAVAVVDGDDRAPAAAAVALDRAQRDLAVRRRLARLDAELALERLERRLRADERARDVRAHLDEVLADGLEVVHVVEARDGHAVRRRQAERLADLLEGVPGQPAVALLREVQRRHDRRARLRVLRRDLLDLV